MNKNVVDKLNKVKELDDKILDLLTKVVDRSCSVKKVFLETLQNSQEKSLFFTEHLQRLLLF